VLRISDALVSDEVREVVGHAAVSVRMSLDVSRRTFAIEAVFPHLDTDNVGALLARVVCPVGRTTVAASRTGGRRGWVVS
jgi:hypothetical protein